METKKIYAKVELEGFGGYTQHLDALQHTIIDDIRCAAENGEVNAKWIITFVEMTESEYQELPEFEGF